MDQLTRPRRRTGKSGAARWVASVAAVGVALCLGVTTNGEDPYLSSEFAAAEINAIQAEGLMAQVKHVSMYSGQDQNTPSLVGSQAAHELYLPAA